VANHRIAHATPKPKSKIGVFERAEAPVGPPRGTSALTIGMWQQSRKIPAPLMSTLDAELNDFGAQLAMLGGHAANRDG
jgi:hypothetical protein